MSYVAPVPAASMRRTDVSMRSHHRLTSQHLSAENPTKAQSMHKPSMVSYVGLCLLVGVLHLTTCDAFSLQSHRRSSCLFGSEAVPEYIGVSDESDESQSPDATYLEIDNESPNIDEIAESIESIEYSEGTESLSEDSDTDRKLLFAAPALGVVVNAKIGDVALARKAWKKRRRSGSPLLVPCSILNVDRALAIKWNLLYLLGKFGTQTKRGARLSFGQLSMRHRTHLKSSLTPHATALGYKSTSDMIEDMFVSKAQERNGAQIVTDKDGERFLQSSLSRFKAQKEASKVPVLQFSSDGNDDTLRHTGVLRSRRTDPVSEDENIYTLQPLSAALRVTQEEIEQGLVVEGSVYGATVFDYDPQGDAGEPLITLSLTPPRVSARDRLKRKHTTICNPKYLFEDLAIGDTVEGVVVGLTKRGALIDCEVGTQASGELVQVLGYLSDRDAALAPSESILTEVEKDMVMDAESRGQSEVRESTGRGTARVGDRLTVIVKSVAKQSRQLKFTMDESIKGKKAKDLKKEASARKKLDRLVKQLGGLDRVDELNGQIMDGIVKASSNTGDWLYVQPKHFQLPVGIATVDDVDGDQQYSTGEVVQIQLNGVDKRRGQLAMRVVGRLSP